MERFSYFKIGLFVISATIIAVIGVVVLGVGALLQKKTILETYIDESVQGLDVGSAVKVPGVSGGKGGQRQPTRGEAGPAPPISKRTTSIPRAIRLWKSTGSRAFPTCRPRRAESRS